MCSHAEGLLECTRAVSACRVASNARLHACHAAITQMPASYARHATDSNPVYCSPFAVTFLACFHFLTFVGRTLCRQARRCAKDEKPHSARTKREWRGITNSSRPGLAISRRRLSRVGEASNVWDLRFLENAPPRFSLFPS